MTTDLHTPATFRYRQLEDWLLQGIYTQRWRAGERLPSVRLLCRQQGLSKATVQHALHRLEAQGLIEARPRAGYFVVPPARHPLTAAPIDALTAAPAPLRIEAPRPVSAGDLFLDIMQRGAAFDLLPDPGGDALPPAIVALNRALGRALRRQRGAAHQYYDDPAGDPGLREQLALHLARRGWPAGPEQLCITAGCQHGLFLALLACCQKGDVVAVESPGFYGVLQLLEQLQLQVVEVPSSPVSGMDMDALAAVLQRWNVKACVVSPAFATPTGALLPAAARQQLLALAEQYDLAIIEDDIYADTAFVRAPDPLRALDRSERVILCGSLSKSLSRDLRLGWISGARWHGQILRLKLVTQLASSRSLQQGVAAFLRDGDYATHLRRQAEALRQQCAQLRTAIQGWPGVNRCSAPQGGLALWVELAPGIDTLRAYPQALAQGLVITPGPLFSVAGQFRHCLRLSFAHPWNPARRAALAQLPQVLGLL
jgi:DNA-binding transcriptional MocR family regulator